MDTTYLQTTLTIVGPVVTAILSSYITWRVKTSSEDRRGFDSLIRANDRFREALQKEVKRKDDVIQQLECQNEALKNRIESMSHTTNEPPTK